MSQDQEHLREALKRTAVALKNGAVPFALGGGYAGWALGGPEPEHDVDFLIPEQDAARAQEVLAGSSLRVREATGHNPYATALLFLLERLQVAPAG